MTEVINLEVDANHMVSSGVVLRELGSRGSSTPAEPVKSIDVGETTVRWTLGRSPSDA